MFNPSNQPIHTSKPTENALAEAALAKKMYQVQMEAGQAITALSKEMNGGKELSSERSQQVLGQFRKIFGLANDHKLDIEYKKAGVTENFFIVDKSDPQRNINLVALSQTSKGEKITPLFVNREYIK